MKANASLDSLLEKEVYDDAETYANELNDGSEYKVSAYRKSRVDYHHEWKKEAYKTMPGHGKKDEGKTDELGNEIRPKFLSNHTHYSPTDPDARIAVKPGKARQLYPVGSHRKQRKRLFRYNLPLPDLRYFSLRVASCWFKQPSQ